MSQSSEIQKIFKSRQVILELMEKQGYDTSKYTGSSITEVSSMHTTQQMDMLLEKTDKKILLGSLNIVRCKLGGNLFCFLQRKI